MNATIARLVQFAKRKAGRALGTVVSVGLAGLLALSGTAAASVAARSGQSAGAAASGKGATADWPAYLNGPLHTSYSPAEKAITPATAADLVLKWHNPLSKGVLASPTVALGAVYIGSRRGWFYKLDEKTGKVLYKVYIGRVPTKNCGGLGIISTATVAPDPVTHIQTVYVSSGNGYLYALRASNLAREWRSVIALPSPKVSNYYDWSSPTVANGKIYVGVSSECDLPQIPGGVMAFSQATGQELARFYTVPRGDIGGSVWSSIAVAPNGDVFATTGNGPNAHPLLGYSESIVKLSPDALKVLGWFQVPAAQMSPDGDFGASPVFFGGDVGACNKNGIFYAVSRSTMRVRWQATIGVPFGPKGSGQCTAAPVYNGHDLFLGGNETTPGSALTAAGTVQERVPSTGALVWESPLPDGVIGSPTMDGGGVIALGTYGGSPVPNYTYLVDAATGQVIRTIAQGLDFAQTVFASNWMFGANNNGVSAWAVKPGS
ncbi:MAG TPA: PQQ-binding-like beta-propeller repeat protein [Streptosporangiaceae bacterium]|nr:PQQ-binding-like beta-propeller repeat protein [Streptosporangiaceae bacterium]